MLTALLVMSLGAVVLGAALGWAAIRFKVEGDPLAERIDALAAKTLPGLQRSVKWGMAYYGVDGGWCFASGAFVGHVKLMFIRGTDLKPEPPVTPVAMGKATRGVELAAVKDLDERQVAEWMKQAAAMPFVSAAKKM